MGKGGGSNKAYKLEKQRQETMKQAIAAINDIFNSYKGENPLTAADQFDASKTYYNSDGTTYTLPTRQEAYTYKLHPDLDITRTGYKTVTDYDALNDAIAGGNVYTDRRSTRQDLYDEQNNAVYELNKNTLDDNYADAERANRFALARNGLTGGSADVDSQADLSERYAKGLVEAKGLGQTAAADLQQSDESAKSNLISLAESGLDAGSAANQAASSLNANYQSALGDRSASTIANAFNNMAQLYLTNKLSRAMADAYNSGYDNTSNINGLNTRKGYQGS